MYKLFQSRTIDGVTSYLFVEKYLSEDDAKNAAVSLNLFSFRVEMDIIGGSCIVYEENEGTIDILS